MLTKAPRKCVVRLTGGCGKMSATDADGLYELFTQGMSGFDGALVFGGTRMVLREDHSVIVPGITEIPSRLRQFCPNMVVLGIIPKTEDLKLDSKLGLIVSSEEGQPFVTAVHPEQDIVLVVQASVDTTYDDGAADETKKTLKNMSRSSDPETMELFTPITEKWDMEYKECLRITQDLRDYGDFKSVLVSYNGGSVTEREILETAKRGWPIVLIRGSGRKTDEYAANADFLATYRNNVAVADKDPLDLRLKLSDFGAMPRQRLALVSNRSA